MRKWKTDCNLLKNAWYGKYGRLSYRSDDYEI